MNEQEFSEIYLKHFQSIKRTCLSIVRNEAQAEELAQDAFLLAWRKRDQYRGESKPETWLTKIAANQALAAKRTLAGKANHVEIEPFHARASNNGEALAQLNKALELLAQLKPAQKEALWATAVEGMTNEEYRSAIGASELAVKMNIVRARRAIRARLEAPMPTFAPADMVLAQQGLNAMSARVEAARLATLEARRSRRAEAKARWLAANPQTARESHATYMRRWRRSA